MSVASRARQHRRLLTRFAPAVGETIEEAQLNSLRLHNVEHARQADVLRIAKIHFNVETLVLKRQRGRVFLLLPNLDGKWRCLGRGATPMEAFITAKISVENHERREAAKAAAAAQPALPDAEAKEAIPA